jgi:hypothetical protein
MKLETWMYKQALELYPKAIRDQFGSAMLETYSDGLKAAKLEGKAIAFHWNTVLDTIKSVARATAEVKNADPVARVTAILGVMFVFLTLAILSRLVWGQTWGYFHATVGAFIFFGNARIGHHFYQTKYPKLFAAMFTSLGIWVLFYMSVGLFMINFFPLEMVFFLSPQNYPEYNVGMLALGYIYKYSWTVPTVLVVVVAVLDIFEKRRVLPMQKFSFSYIAFSVLIVAVDPRLNFLPFRILYFACLILWLLFFLFCCLRTWQLPRGTPQVAKIT